MRKGAFWSVRFWHRIWPGVRRGATRWHTATPQCRSIKRCLQHFPPAIFWRRDRHQYEKDEKAFHSMTVTRGLKSNGTSVPSPRNSGIVQIPYPDEPNYLYLEIEVRPFEQRWPRVDHEIYFSLADSFTEFLQHSPMRNPPSPAERHCWRTRLPPGQKNRLLQAFE